MPGDFVIGIDGGGTRTRAVTLSTDGKLLGYAESGPTNINNRPLTEVVRKLAVAVRGAIPRSQKGHKPSMCFAGCAGIKSPEDALAFSRAVVGANLTSRCEAGSDADAALAGGLAGAPGLVLIAGTGSYCVGRDASGRVAGCGGWGWLIDDVGSGYFLGRETLRAVLLAADGRGPPTVLTARVLKHYGVRHADRLLAPIYRDSPFPARIAAFAPAVLEAADAGDRAAKQIVTRGTAGLAELVTIVSGKLRLPRPKIVLAGGLLTSAQSYATLVVRAIHARTSNAAIVPASLPPVLGAGLRALARVDRTPDKATLATLRLDYERLAILGERKPS